MVAEIANSDEMVSKTAFGEHAVGVAANRKATARFHGVMAIEIEAVGGMGNRALIDHRLAMVFAGILQAIKIEQPIGG